MQNSLDTKKLVKNIDYNCNLGRSEEDWEQEKKLIEYVSSINITCGIHTANSMMIKKILDYSRYKNKVIGAQIGFPEGYKFDINNINTDEIETMVLYQVGALASFAKSYGLLIEHVRPEGEMYTAAAQSIELSIAIAKGITKFSKWLIYYGAASQTIKEVAAQTNINIAQELSLIKRYTEQGIIDVNSNEQNDRQKAINRLNRLIETSEIDCNNGVYTEVEFDTINFSTETKDFEEIAKEAKSIKIPHPVNYNKTESSGWV